MLGRSLSDIQSRYPHLPYQLTASENGLPVINTRSGARNPVEVSADILREVSKRAESALGGEVEG